DRFGGVLRQRVDGLPDVGAELDVPDEPLHVGRVERAARGLRAGAAHVVRLPYRASGRANAARLAGLRIAAGRASAAEGDVDAGAQFGLRVVELAAAVELDHVVGQSGGHVGELEGERARGRVAPLVGEGGHGQRATAPL